DDFPDVLGDRPVPLVLALVHRGGRASAAIARVSRRVVRVGAARRSIARREPSECGDGETERQRRRGSLPCGVVVHTVSLTCGRCARAVVEGIPRNAASPPGCRRTSSPTEERSNARAALSLATNVGARRAVSENDAGTRAGGTRTLYKLRAGLTPRLVSAVAGPRARDAAIARRRSSAG